MFQRKIVEFAIFFIVFLAIDSIWILGYAAGQYRAFYKALTGNEMRVYLPAALICYLVLALALYLVYQQVRGKPIKDILIAGAAIGFLIYGVYDMTTAAIFGRSYLKIGLMDWIWGTFAMGSALGIGSAIIKKMSA